MIVVNVTGVRSNVKNLTELKNDLNKNYNNYYKKTEETSNSWVGMIATKFFDTQLENRNAKMKIVDNVASYCDLMSFIVDLYSNDVQRNIKIDLNKKQVVENKYLAIDRDLELAYDYLENVNNIGVSVAQGYISNAREKLEGTKSRTMTLFENVKRYENQIKTKSENLVINKIEELSIDKYMIE